MRREEADGCDGASQPRCETEKTLLGKECERPGEVRYGGMLLCPPHAALLGLEDRAEALLGSAVRMSSRWRGSGGLSPPMIAERLQGVALWEREEALEAAEEAAARVRGGVAEATGGAGTVTSMENYEVPIWGGIEPAARAY